MKSRFSSYIAVGQAVLAAVLFGMSAPFSKLLLSRIPPLMLSALLYIGAGAGMFIIGIIRKAAGIHHVEARLTKKESPFVVLMIILDVAAPISLMVGLTMTTSSNASLLNNFEIVSTSIIALLIFKEAIGRRLWLSIGLITLSSVILTVRDFNSLSFSIGSIFVLLACVFWGFENNCTRKLSLKDPLQIVIIKGFGSGLCGLVIAIIANEVLWDSTYIVLSLLLGLFAYGMSIYFYVAAQRHLGAARTSAYYAVAPFIGVGISFAVFSEPVSSSFIAASVVMLIGTYLAIVEKHQHQHTHTYIEHEHRHNHLDGHHNHTHEVPVIGEHTHIHIHEELVHTHPHTPDMHHTHKH